jgi:hypothetical protein
MDFGRMVKLFGSRFRVATNGWQPYAVGAFNHCINLKAQNYE